MEALKSGMSVKVEKGCANRGVKKGMTLKVESVTELGPDYSHMVKVLLSVQGRLIAFYARHPNRLADVMVSMNTGRPEDRIVVRRVDSPKL
jgi:hypothetical protein